MDKKIYLAGGCFWGTEHYLKQIRGVTATQVGYANGNRPNPSYEEVCTGTTHAAETVMVTYDPAVLPLKRLLNIYFKAIDPTSLNQQGPDRGTQYRTGIYYVDDADLPLIQQVMEAQQRFYSDLIEVEVLPLANFYLAEEYHQDYLVKNPQGYCHLPRELFKLAREANSQR